MGLFDDIPIAGAGAPAPAPRGLFDDIPVPSPSIEERSYDKDARRQGMEQGLTRYAEEHLGRPTQGEAALLGAAQGWTQQHADEGAGLVNAGVDFLQGKGFNLDARTEQARQGMRDAQFIYPKTFMAAEIPASVGSAMAAPGGFLGSVGVGALSGEGAGEGPTGKVAGTLSGAVLGGTAHGVIAGVTRAGREVLNRSMNTLRSFTDPAARARDKVVGASAQDIGNGSAPLTGAEVATARGQGQPLALIDEGGAATRKLATSAKDASPDAKAALEQLTNPRFENQAQRADDFLVGMYGRGARDTDGMLTRLREDSARQTNPLYIAAYNAGDRPLVTPQLERLAQAPLVQQAMRNAAENAQNHSIAQGHPQLRPDIPNLQFWDYTKRELDRLGGGANGDPNARTLANMLRTHLDDLVPQYQPARGAAARFFNGRDAVEVGQEYAAGKVPAGQMQRAIQHMSQAERDLLEASYIGTKMNQVREVRGRQTIVGKVFKDSPAEMERMELVLGPQRAQQIQTYMRVEGVMDLARNAVQGGSRTAEFVRDGTFAGIGGLAGNSDMVDGVPYSQGIGAVLGVALSRGVGGANRRVAMEVGRLLASEDPAIAREAADIIARSRILSHALQSAESALARSTVAPSTTAATPAVKAVLGGTPKAAAEENRDR